MKRRRKKKTASVRYLSAEMGRHRILAARTPRGGESWRIHLRRLAVIVILLALLALGVTALVQGIRWAGRKLLWENDAYKVRTINVMVDGRLSREHVLEFMNLPDDMNLWALLLTRRASAGNDNTWRGMTVDQIRESFLRRIPSVSDMDIAVRLPDRLDVRVKERVPFAIVDAGRAYGDFVVDRHGIVFFDPRRDDNLPLIAGVPSDNLMPGVDLSGSLTASLHLLDMVRQPRYNRDINIRRLNVAAQDYLECWLDNGTHVTILWPAMHESGAAGVTHLELKLNSLRSVLRDSSETGQRLQSINLTLTEDNIPATPEANQR